MIVLCQNTIFQKEYLMCNGCFELFNKIRKGSGANFSSTFSARFFHKNVPYLILYQLTKFQCYTLFLSQYIKQNVLSSFCLSSWWHHKFWGFSWINLWGNGWHGKKRGRRKYKNFNILSMKRAFLFSFSEKYKFGKK